MVKADINLRIYTDGEPKFRRVAAILKSYVDGKEMNQALRTHFRKTAQPIVDELRAAVKSVGVSSKLDGRGRPQRSTQLRSRVASAVRMSVAYAGINFTVLGSAVGPYGSTLAKYLDGTLSGYKAWRHPVFGTDRWEVQYGQPWFFTTIEANAGALEEACSDALDEIAAQIETRTTSL